MFRVGDALSALPPLTDLTVSFSLGEQFANCDLFPAPPLGQGRDERFSFYFSFIAAGEQGARDDVITSEGGGCEASSRKEAHRTAVDANFC